MITALVLTALIAHQETEAESRMGMTDRQIVALGMSGFIDKYSEKFGSSTAAMCDASTTYGASIKRINDAALKKKPATLKSFVGSLRPRLSAFRSEIVDIGRSYTGGGTMWNIVYCETVGDVEETIGIFTGLRPNKSKSLKVSDGTKSIDGLDKFMKENAEEIDSYQVSGGGMAEVRESLGLARKQYAEIVKIAAKRPRRESDAIIAFVIDAVRMATE